jgi:hypothetical protein
MCKFFSNAINSKIYYFRHHPKLPKKSKIVNKKIPPVLRSIFIISLAKFYSNKPTIRSATIFKTLIIGLMAGPAVSL